jgi:arylformamidase
MAVWEGQPPVSISYIRHLSRGDRSTVSRLAMTVHTGTHVDAPRHHVAGGPGADELDLETLVGTAFVADAGDAATLSAGVVATLGIPLGSERVLFRTSNSRVWSDGVGVFTKDYVGLTEDGAYWLVDQGVRLVGTDYLSVAAWEHLVAAHRALLTAGVILLEGLDLTGVAGGLYHLVCLPMKISGGDGAPARAILVDSHGQQLPSA